VSPPPVTEYGAAAREAIRARFPADELPALARKPYPVVLREARERRAAALLASRWEETEESRRETPVIVTLDAFYTEAEVAAGAHHRVPWDGGLL
jgi:hypothetical protein